QSSRDTSSVPTRHTTERNMSVLWTTFGGTRFGSSSGMLPASHAPRRRDRRRGFAELLAVIARNLDRRGDNAFIRGAFEETLRRIVPIRTARLRETGQRWPFSADGAQEAEVIALEVPGGDPDTPAVLEATFDAGCRLGEWDFQALSMAAHLGALVLEIERGRTQMLRAGLVPLARAKRDGAAPLIGSTSVMAQLRSTLERVAGTDFTV